MSSLEKQWENLETQYLQLIHDVIPFLIPTKSEIEKLELSELTYGLVKSDFGKAVELGYAYVYRKPDKIAVAKRIAFEFGFGGSELPDHLSERNEPLVHIVDRFLKSRSSELIEAWGELKFVYGLYVTLFAYSESDEADLLRATRGRLGQSSKIQEHWYAHWIAKHCPDLFPRKRIKAEDDLVAVIKEMKSGKMKPWGPYPLNWYTRMLDTKNSNILKSTYRDLSNSDLEARLANTIISASVLPPLTPSGFSAKK
jgi:hypothetical protein